MDEKKKIYTIGEDDGGQWIRHDAEGCRQKSYYESDIKFKYCTICGIYMEDKERNDSGPPPGPSWGVAIGADP